MMSVSPEPIEDEVWNTEGINLIGYQTPRYVTMLAEDGVHRILCAPLLLEDRAEDYDTDDLDPDGPDDEPCIDESCDCKDKSYVAYLLVHPDFAREFANDLLAALDGQDVA